jgi:uncharacterized protein YbjT (DUF2867 family)
MGDRTVIIAGATGLVGRELLNGLLLDPTIGHVHSLGRRTPLVQHAKLTPHVVDFAALPDLPLTDEVYLALGTTIKVAGSQEAFRAVDYDANLAVARASLRAGAKRAGLISAMGANSKSKIFYNRVKGELEEALAKLNFQGLVIARPSLLVGDREAVGQPSRPGERMGHAIGQALGALIPANYKPIEAERVARALLANVPKARGVHVLLSGEMQRFTAARAREGEGF